MSHLKTKYLHCLRNAFETAMSGRKECFKSTISVGIFLLGINKLLNVPHFLMFHRCELHLILLSIIKFNAWNVAVFYSN